jgi:hypothetical protein
VAWIPWETRLARVHPDVNRDSWGFGEEKMSPGDLPENGIGEDELSGWPPSTNSIPEAPEPDSDFRSHRQVANALVETITSGDDGLGIALTGTVGSGKSSIVERMEKQLKEGGTKTRVFTYDIWVHRGDSIRRSFIEELARDLEEAEWIKNRTAEDAKDDVLKQETESKSGITIVGAVIAVLLTLLSPSLLLTRAEGDDVFAESIPYFGSIDIPTGSTGALLVIGIAFLFAIGLVAAILWKILIWLPWVGKSRGPSLISRDTSVTIEEADASTVDFRKAFEKLVGSALEEDADRKLVVVIDNLDRFTPEDVYETWTNLQTFFELSTSNRRGNDDLYNRFWTILPFSPEAPYRLRRMLEQEEDSDGDEATVSLVPDTPPFEEYIDKTFQLRFRVSPPVQTDFEEYFVQQFDEAIKIPDDQETVARVRDLFFRFLNRGATPPGTFQSTPRTVNRYMNDLVGSIRQYGTTPPIPVQAYFLLLKKKHGDDLDETKIRKGDELNLGGVEPIVGAREKGLKRKLLMLYHGIRANKVAQILIRSKVQNAIAEGDHETLEEHKGKAGFESIVREQVHWLRARTIGERIATAAVALKNVDTDFLPERCWSLLIEGIREVETVDVRSSTVGEGLNVLIDKQAEEEGEEEGDVEKLERSVLKLLRTMLAN